MLIQHIVHRSDVVGDEPTPALHVLSRDHVASEGSRGGRGCTGKPGGGRGGRRAVTPAAGGISRSAAAAARAEPTQRGGGAARGRWTHAAAAASACKASGRLAEEHGHQVPLPRFLCDVGEVPHIRETRAPTPHDAFDALHVALDAQGHSGQLRHARL